MGEHRVGGVAAGLCGAAVMVACALPAPPRPVAPVGPAVATTIPSPASVPVEVRVPAPASVPTTAPAPVHLPPGVHEHQIHVDGHSRRWTTVVPPGLASDGPPALVVVLHGVGGRGADMRSTGLEPLAAASRAVLAYPDAVGGAWNDGRPGVDPALPGVIVDDVRFLRLVIDETVRRTGADARRVAVVGYSNGAVMAGRVACDFAQGVSAVALVAGSAGQGFEQSCRPARPVAVMLVAGSNDRIVPYGGGRVPDWGTRKRGFVAPVDDVFAFWRNQSGCAATHVAASPPQVQVARGADCRSAAGVVRYRVVGGGHEWFRGPGLDTTGAVWDFLTRRFATSAA